tara:strand:- start:210 stop:1715 length:1506 start_codon:yes stop_codon:yes gene_type:complete
MGEVVTDTTLFSIPIGTFEGCGIGIVSAENRDLIIQASNKSEPRPISITLKESIFNSYIVGELELDVPNGFLESGKARITSQDILILDIKTPVSLVNPGEQGEDDFVSGVNLKGAFFINSVTKVSSTEKTTKMNLKFMTFEGLKDTTTTVVKSYNKMKRSEIVKSIYTDYIEHDRGAKLSSLLFTNTEHDDFCCVFPNWSPSKCINWLIAGSVDSNEPRCTNFFFFQRFNKDGEVESVFASLNDMAKGNPVLGTNTPVGYTEGYIVDILNDEEDPRKENHRIRRTILNANFRIPDMNTTKYNRYGTWGGTLYFYDQTRKKYFEKKYNYKKDELGDGLEGPVNDVLPGAGPFIDENTKKFIEDEYKGLPDTLGAPNSFKAFSPKHKFLFHSKESDEGVDRKEQWLDTTITQRNLNIYAPIDIEIIGDSNRRVGECVTFADMQIQNLSNDQPSDTKLDNDNKSLGGKYLITDVTHTFTFATKTEEQYFGTKLKMIRDGAPDGK